jgi:hypothetical protein
LREQSGYIIPESILYRCRTQSCRPKADDSIEECRYGKSPVRLIDAEPASLYLQGVAFELPGKSLFTDEKNGIEIRIIEKISDSYKIRISSLK